MMMIMMIARLLVLIMMPKNDDEGGAEDDEREGSYYGFLFWTEWSCDKILYTGFCVGPPLAPVLAATAD